MDPIEFSVPIGLEYAESVLGTVALASLFSTEPDRLKKDTEEHKSFRLILSEPGSRKPVILGLVELIGKEENQTLIRLTEHIVTRRNGMPQTGSPLMRFFCLFTQQLLELGVTPFND